MHIPISIDAQDFPRVFQRFCFHVQGRPWMKTLKHGDLNRGRPFAEALYRRRYEIAYGVEKIERAISRSGRVAGALLVDGEVYEAAAFVTQLAALIKSSPAKEAKALAGRAHGSFSNHEDLVALAFELKVATHVLRRGFNVVPRLQGGGADLIASRDGPDGGRFEIECKVVTEDKGRAIHRHVLADYHDAARKSLKSVKTNLGRAVIAMAVFEGRPSASSADQKSIASKISSGLKAGAVDAEFDGFKIRYVDLGPATQFPDESSFQIAARAKLAMLQVSTILSVARIDCGQMVGLTFHSLLPDKTLKEIFRTLCDASKRQLALPDGGLLAVKIANLHARELERIGDESGAPTALRIEVTNFFASSSAEKVAGLMFFADADVERYPGDRVTRGGATYTFLSGRLPNDNLIGFLR